MRQLALAIVIAGCGFSARNTENNSDARMPGDAAADASAAGDGGGGSGSGSGTTKRKETLTILNSTRATAFSNFTVMVALDATRIDYAACPGGANLRFTDPDGTALKYEIERWDPTSTSIVWVRVPQIDASSNTDYITMHWGDPALTDAQSPAQTWDHTALVYHLAEDPTAGTVDSTGQHAGSATAQMSSADLVRGKIGQGVRFDGLGGGIHTASTGLARYTWMMWLRADAAPMLGANHEPITDGDSNFNFAWDHSSAAYVGALAMKDATMWHSAQGTGFQGGTWYHLVGTYDGTNLCLRVDTAQKVCVASGSPATPSPLFQLGDATSNVATFAGVLDEVRVYDLARGDAWIDAEQASQTDALITYGAPVAEP